MTREEFMDIVYSELHSDGDNYRANRIIDAADEYAEAQSRWIPVTERVPEDRGYYLVTILAENGYHRSREVIYFGDDFKWSTTRDVIAWMPLLEPFKAESEDEE